MRGGEEGVKRGPSGEMREDRMMRRLSESERGEGRGGGESQSQLLAHCEERGCRGGRERG